jgi:transposase
VDLAELAKLRYLQGWSRQRLASHYGRTLHAITNYCQTIRRREYDLPGLTAKERDKIQRAVQD